MMGHAGAGAAQFVAWRSHFAPDVWLRAVRLPGREARVGEPAHESVAAMVAELCSALVGSASLCTYLYGHCLGALVMFELARALSDRGCLVRGIVVSAQGAPDGLRSESPSAGLSSPAFWDMVRQQGGLPDEILASPEMRELVEPALRADWLATDGYVFGAKPKLNVPITAVWGTRDRLVTRDEMCGWRRHSAARFRLRELEGDHFLLAPQTMDAVGSVVASAASATEDP
jgi:medium-chain acyl-[acyl-carrier-protein] hydrolase